MLTDSTTAFSANQKKQRKQHHMGVPRFYSWLCHACPSLVSTLEGTDSLHCDHFYIDMNGILYLMRESTQDKQELIIKTFFYLEELVFRVKPSKTLFIAIDGIPPRAKTVQQRQRRWSNFVQKIQQGKTCENDSNAMNFTAGTLFMNELSAHMSFFVRRKIQDDKLWQKLQVYVSDAQVPGEGEHKIMEFVRKNQQATSKHVHCMYGMDAGMNYEHGFYIFRFDHARIINAF